MSSLSGLSLYVIGLGCCGELFAGGAAVRNFAVTISERRARGALELLKRGGYSLIDCGAFEAWSLRDAGLLEGCCGVYVTHEHPGHSGGLPCIRGLGGSLVVAGAVPPMVFGGVGVSLTISPFSVSHGVPGMPAFGVVVSANVMNGPSVCISGDTSSVVPKPLRDRVSWVFHDAQSYSKRSDVIHCRAHHLAEATPKNISVYHMPVSACRDLDCLRVVRPGDVYEFPFAGGVHLPG